MPWKAGPFNGFSAVEPWLLSEPRPAEHTAEAQENDEASYLHSHRRLLAVRRRLFDTEGLAGEAVDWGRDGDGAVIVLHRGSVVAAANTADAEATVQLPPGSELLYETPASTCGAAASLPAQVHLAPRSAIVCRTS